ncbi:TP901 family phage tail tape measure protein [Haloactinopolyspora alba]|uniref:TP901 family phage tail tape measure protein n=1 Tax=Haloactinopolyspora alba TaxID=648780 RepID=A0A2P8DHM3_9ACTN|nr:phage tail tape measure protein [Haloactinopolyspora alba]PSK96703.1 TP901 family phage tail tape measure protein [Haloactinopolyspora alba]
MADRSIVVKLGLDVGGVVAGARTATRALKQVSTDGLDWVGQREQSINTLTTGVGAFGLAAAAGAGLAVKKFADFDAAMSAVEATGDDARASIDALRQAAIDAGASTAFSATEAAAGIEQLAKAGVTAEDILAGGLTGALDLAAAGGISVGEAAETAATALTQFDLAGEDVTHVADLLAAGAGKAQGGVTELGQALAQSGLVASQTGLTIEETAASLSAFASAGLLGSDAGTSFKTMLQRLSNPTGEAADLMQRLNVSAYDAQGNFVGMAEFAGQLQGALEDMTPAQRNATLATLFGSDAVRAASVIYEEGKAGIQEWTAAVDDQGYAAETAATRLDNLKGDLEELGGALETALIGAGEGADGPLRSLTQRATDAVNAFNDMPPEVKSATLAIVGGGGLVALGVAGIGKLVVGVANTRDAMRDLGISTSRVGRTMRLLGGAATGIGLLASAMDLLGQTVDVAEVGTGAAAEALQDLRKGANSELINQIADLRGELDGADKVLGFIPTSLDGFTTSAKDSAEVNKQWKESITAVDGALSSMVASGSVGQAKESVKLLGEAMGLSGDEMQKFVEEHLPQYADALAQSRVQTEANTEAAGQAGTAQNQLSQDFDSTTEGIQTQAEALVNLVEKMQEAGLLALSTRDAERNLQAAIDNATTSIEENGTTLDVTTEKGRKNQAALDEIASSSLDLVSALADQGASEKRLQKVMANSRASFIKTARRMGLTKGQARALADQLGLIPGNYRATISAQDNASDKIEDAVWWLKDFDGREATATMTTVQRTIREIWNSPTSGIPGQFTPGNATGTRNWRGGLTWVGEEGPEIVSLPRGSDIYSNAESRAMASGGPLHTLMPAAAPVQSTSTLHPSALAAALDGVSLTLDVDGQPMRGIIRAEQAEGLREHDRQTMRRASTGTAVA